MSDSKSDRGLTIQYNDILAIFILSIITLMWILDGMGAIKLSEMILGALITAFNMIIIYYFRKKQGDSNSNRGI